MSFDHPHTCPDINKAIESFEDTCKNYLIDILSDACPLLEGEAKNNIVKRYIEYICNETIDIFEDVRKTNSDIRDEAEKQIDAIDTENRDLKDEIEDLYRQLEEKYQEINELENQL